MNTYHIHIMGQVQGVGFRPYVYRIAQKLTIHGQVYNAIDGVHVIFNAHDSGAREFYELLISSAPVISKITTTQIAEIPKQNFTEFSIVSSEDNGQCQVLITPDFAMCAACRVDLNNLKSSNRRAGYPFITCTSCGPRYSIIQQLPYDRTNTVMNSFDMCQACEYEYDEPADRRYYSQTNSCTDCGISLVLFENGKNWSGKNYTNAINKAVALLNQGKIIAVKGIGGYLLLCDAADEESIRRMRTVKNRPSKPFALMYPTLEMLRGDVWLSPVEEETLLGPSSPLVLLACKENSLSNICLSEIAPGLTQVGAMLPYAPIYEVLLNAWNKPAIATSANISSSPILFEEEDAIEQLKKMADLIISNNREIVTPQDDSVIKYSYFESQKIVIRRSRGLAPTYINPDISLPSENILATGAQLKSTFTLTHQQNIYISQYLGDLDNYDVQKNYQQCLEHFYHLLHSQTQVILTDKHPDYFSTRYGLDLGKKLNITVTQYQHHEAHFAAVLGENNLLHNDQSVLGIIWDGVGLGNDGQVWGGEFFIYKNYEFKRCNHFGYFDYLLRDKMAREPRISALAVTAGLANAEILLKNKFSEKEWLNYQIILQKKGHLQTSSAGRLFDAVASLLGLCDISSYEGEAAMYLEALGLDYFKKNGLRMTETYFDDITSNEISCCSMLSELITDITKGKNKGYIAAKFHYSLATLVKKMAVKLNIQHIALSGGVFQNALLVDLIKIELTPDQHLYLHRQLSPNDECISFGQLCSYIIEDQKSKHAPLKNQSVCA